MSNREATPEVLEMEEIPFEGNTIPTNWYVNILFENGKTDLNSIVILAEIAYWFRPSYKRDESNPSLDTKHRKFSADILQYSKKALGQKFGLSEKQVQDSMARLEKAGLISREFRVVEQGSYPGVMAYNVPFVRIHPKAVKKITIQKLHTYGDQTPYPPISNSIGSTVELHTNTKNTAKIVSKKKKKAALPSISFDHETSSFENLTDQDIADWKALYPNVDISRELALMRQWLLDPDKPERDGNRSFITNWLSKAYKDLSKAPKKSTIPKTEVEEPAKDHLPVPPGEEPVYFDLSLARRAKHLGEEKLIRYLKRVTDQSHYLKYLETKELE